MIKLKNKLLLFASMFGLSFLSFSSNRVPTDAVINFSNYKEFAECNVEAGGYIGNIVNRLVCTTTTITNEMMYNLSLTLGVLLLFIVIVDILKDIISNLSNLSIEEVFKTILSKSVMQALVIGALLIPVGRKTTVYGAFINVLFKVFNGVGMLFWLDGVQVSSSFRGTVGEITEVLVKLPIDIISNSLRISSIFAVFLAIPILVIGVYIFVKVLGIASFYISTVFEFLILGALSMFYLIFYLFSATKDKLGTKALSLIVTQGIKLSMVTGMIGITYSVMKYIQYESDSFWWLFSIAVGYTILEKCINSIGDIAYSIVQGGGLGQSKATNFTGMLGTVVGATGVGAMALGGGVASFANNVKGSLNEGKGVGDALKDAMGQSGLGKGLDNLKSRAEGLKEGLGGLKDSIGKNGIRGVGEGLSKFKHANNKAASKVFQNNSNHLREGLAKHGSLFSKIKDAAQIVALVANLSGEKNAARIFNMLASSYDPSTINKTADNLEAHSRNINSDSMYSNSEKNNPNYSNDVNNIDRDYEGMFNKTAENAKADYESNYNFNDDNSYYDKSNDFSVSSNDDSVVKDYKNESSEPSKSFAGRKTKDKDKDEDNG